MYIRNIASSSASRGTGRVVVTALHGKRILVVDDERAIGNHDAAGTARR